MTINHSEEQCQKIEAEMFKVRNADQTSMGIMKSLRQKLSLERKGV